MSDPRGQDLWAGHFLPVVLGWGSGKSSQWVPGLASAVTPTRPRPRDKAGAYGIQALGGMLVERVHGDFLNVVGFPLNRFCRELGRILTGNSGAQTGESLSCVNKTSLKGNSLGVSVPGLAVSQNPPVAN